LNTQSGGATFRYCDRASKDLLRDLMMNHYQRWLVELRNARGLLARDLFLVTGTYTTQNWEAATFQRGSLSVGADITVDATLVGGKLSIDWRTWTPGNRGFRLGHTHLGRDRRGRNLPNHNSTRSFGACCAHNSCTPPLENQAIFLRGWQVRPILDFERSQLTIPVSVENVTNPQWRRIQRIRRTSYQVPQSSFSSIEGKEAQGTRPVAVGSSRPFDLVEAEGTPSDVDTNDIYDFIAVAEYQKQAREVIMIHDDDVIAYLSGSSTPEMAEASAAVNPSGILA